MTNKIRIAVLGLTHDHVWSNLESLAECAGAELVAAFDVHDPLLKRVANQYGCPVYSSFEQLRDGVELDGVYVFSSNLEGSELAVRALENKWHVLIEKPMAATLAAAERMRQAALDNQRRLLINWPFCWWPQLRLAIEMAQSGAIGEIWQVKYRAAHAGPKELGCSDYFCEWLFDEERNGGGALMDYCCYGCLLARVLMGMPTKITGISGRYQKDSIDVEDNALIAMEYPGGIATAEGSWTQIGKLTSYTTAIFGSTGTLLVEPRADGKLLLATATNEDGTPVEIPATPKQDLNSAEHFVHCIDTGSDPMPLCAPTICRDVQEILQLGQQSQRESRSLSL